MESIVSDWVKSYDSLKGFVPTYPKMNIDTNENVNQIYIRIQTMLRIERDGIYYLVLLNQNYDLIKFEFLRGGIVSLLNVFAGNVYNIQQLYIITEDNSIVDPDQTNEVELLMRNKF